MIRARGLGKCYGALRAIDDVGFQVARGEVVGFLGPNGAGKSTTMKVLTGYLYPDAGSVEIAGHPLCGEGATPASVLEARRHIGYLPENTPLYRDMRVDRYLAYVSDVRGLPRAGRADRIERVVVSCGLPRYAGSRIRTLSKGYRQRVGLAQALLSDPDVLILDEPTSGLDPQEILRIRELVVSLGRDKTILLSTHVLPEVEEVCQRAIIIASGRIVADGTLVELSANGEQSLSVVVAGEPAEVVPAFESIEGVRDVRIVAHGAEGRVRLRVGLVERFDAAAGVSRMAADRGWPLFELRHEVPTLESVFLEQTGGLRASRESEAVS